MTNFGSSVKNSVENKLKTENGNLIVGRLGNVLEPRSSLAIVPLPVLVL